MERIIPRSSRLLFTATLLVAGMFAVPQADAAFDRLSGTMPDTGDVIGFQISPDGQYVVYGADQETDEVVDLYSVPLSGGAPVRLTQGLSADDSITRTHISPDSRYVVYIINRPGTEADDLYSVPIAGPATASVKLNGTLPAGGRVSSFAISPDSTRVVYRADQDTAGTSELYSVPIAGPPGAGLKLNGTLPSGGRVSSFAISPDSMRVVYRADQDTAGTSELYSVSIAGPTGTGVKLNQPLVTNGNVTTFQISPASTRVVYYADQQVDQVFSFFSVPIAGPASAGVAISPPIVAGGIVSALFQISPDSAHVVYLADQDTPGTDELYRAPITGPASAGVKLNGPLAPGGSVRRFQISPDSARVVYLADQDTLGRNELYSVPITGPASAGIKLNRPLPPGGQVPDFLFQAFAISPDSTRVVYRADQEIDEVFELYSVPITGPTAASIKLNRPLVTGGAVGDFQISPDSTRVVYRADQEIDQVVELFSVPIASPADAGLKLNGPLVPGGDVLNPSPFGIAFASSPDNWRVVYIADQERDDVFELYVADVGQSRVGFVSATITVAEDAGNVTLEVALTAPSVGPVTVGYAVTGGTASGGGVDYTLNAGTLTFAPGTTSQTIDLTIIDDELNEPDETVVITLANPQNATPGSVTSLTLTIVDDDPEAAPANPTLYLPVVRSR